MRLSALPVVEPLGSDRLPCRGRRPICQDLRWSRPAGKSPPGSASAPRGCWSTSAPPTHPTWCLSDASSRMMAFRQVTRSDTRRSQSFPTYDNTPRPRDGLYGSSSELTNRCRPKREVRGNQASRGDPSRPTSAVQPNRLHTELRTIITWTTKRVGTGFTPGTSG